MQTKLAFMYDFDKTLCTKDMQEYGFIPQLNMSTSEFWGNVSEQTTKYNMDYCLSYMFYMVKKAHPIQESNLKAMGTKIELFPGVEEWFDRINEYALKRNIVIEHYIISSGLKEIISGCSIADKFKQIYACSFIYDEIGNAMWPAMAVNYTNKTQFLFRINKGTLDIFDEKINEKMPEDKKYISFNHMVYLGDGMTDVPCMSLVKDKGGYSIAIYNENKETSTKLKNDGRVNFTAQADYRENQSLDIIVKKIIDKICCDESLEQEK